MAQGEGEAIDPPTPRRAAGAPSAFGHEAEPQTGGPGAVDAKGRSVTAAAGSPQAPPSGASPGAARAGASAKRGAPLAHVTPLPPRVATWVLAGWLLAATALGAALRLYQLDGPSFWADELYSIRSITDDKAIPLWRVLAHSSTWFGLMMSGADLASASADAPERWRALGIDEFTARIGPAILGILSVPALALVGRRVLGDRGAIMLALLLAVWPWHIEWSQNARFYVGLFLFYGLSLLLYFDATTRLSRGRMVLAMLCFVLAFMHHPPGVFLAGVFLADWLVSTAARRRPRLGAFGYIAGTVALALCLLLLYISMLTLTSGFEVLEDQPRGHDVTMLTAGTVYLVHPAVLVFATITAWMLIVGRERLGWYLLLAAVLPLGVLVYLSAADTMFVHVRYGFMAAIGWLALAAVGLDRLYGRAVPRFGRVFAVGAAAMLIVALLQMDLFYHGGGHGFRSRWHDGFQYIREHRQAGDVVATDFTLAGRYYLERDDLVGLPESAEQLAEFDGTVWLIAAVESAQGEEASQWIGDAAELRAYFDTRIEQPFSSVRVYRRAGAERRTGP